jgi:hypothetical protein
MTSSAKRRMEREIVDCFRSLDVDRDLGKLGPVSITNSGGELTLEAAPDATDPDGIVDDVIRARLADGDRRKTSHDATSRAQPRG